MMKSYLKKLTLVISIAVGISASSFALDLWNIVGDTTAPSYRVELFNNSSKSIECPTMPGNFINPTESMLFEVTGDQLRNWVQTVDSSSFYFPESQVFDCPTAPGMPFSLHYKHFVYNPANTAANEYVMADAIFCVKDKCDTDLHTPYTGISGYLRIEFSDDTASPPPVI